MRLKQIFILLILILGWTGCSVQNKLIRDYKGKTQEELLLLRGRPTRVEALVGGGKIDIYEKSKFLKPAPINTGQFQYERFDSPKALKTEIFQFFLDKEGVIENVKYEVKYER